MLAHGDLVVDEDHAVAVGDEAAVPVGRRELHLHEALGDVVATDGGDHGLGRVARHQALAVAGLEAELGERRHVDAAADSERDRVLVVVDALDEDIGRGLGDHVVVLVELEQRVLGVHLDL